MVEHVHLGHEYSPLKGPQLENPYPFYACARREEPVFFSEELNAWIITRYDDVKSILLQPNIFSSKDTLRPVVQFTPETLQVLSTGVGFLPNIINTDGDEHMRFRTPLNRAFLPANMKAMESEIRALANSFIDGFSESGNAEIIEQFAGPLPQTIILRLYDIPLTQLAQCKHWCDDVKALTQAPLTPERQVECAHSMIAFQKYLATLVEERKLAPKNDVISCLATTHHDVTRPLNLREIVITAMGTILAGHDTSTCLISNALYHLLSRPQRWQTLCEHPEDIPAALEEVLRFDGSIHTFLRTALREVTIGGVTIPEGAYLLLSHSSANHDEAQFPNPEEFDMHRSPNRHLGLGLGVHFCVGAPLGRLVGRIALETLSQHLPNLRLKPNQTVSHLPQIAFRGLARLELEWDRVPSR